MGSRETILSALRATSLADVERPEIEGPWITYQDPVAQFIEVSEAVGGRAVRADGGLRAALDGVEPFREATSLCSLLPDVVEGNIDLASCADSHRLEDVDCAVVPGQFGVAENGAVWVTGEGVRHQAIYFIVQHLVLVVSASEIVHNMHEAYRRLQIDRSAFGLFVSGPSKTADIEQSLVIGAQGPRSLHVLLDYGAADR